MNAVEAGTEISGFLVHVPSHLAFLLGLHMAFIDPEYARALYEAGAADGDPETGETPEEVRMAITNWVREWITRHPIEVPA